MSPEQAAGETNIGAATDVYALGCVLYEMLVGEPPYTGRTPQAVLARVMQAELDPVHQHRRSVPLNVEAAIERALEKVPADRFATAGDFARALSDPSFRHRTSASAGTLPGRWRVTAVAGWVVAAVLALGTSVWAMLGTASEPAGVSRHVLAQDGWAGVDVAFGQLAAVAPDGSSIVLPVRTPGGALQLGLKLRGSTEVRPIPGTAGGQDVAFSPDGRSIVFARGTNLVRVDLTGGAAVTLAEDVHSLGAAIAWMDDGNILYEQVTGFAFMSPSRIARIPAAGGAPLQVIETSVAGLSHPIWMDALPNGRGALVVGCNVAVTCSAEGANLFVLDLASGSVESIIEGVMRAWYVEPAGQLVFVRPDGAVFTTSFDLDTLRPGGSSIPLIDGVRVGFNHVDMSIGADGTVVYVEGPSTSFGLSRLVWVDRSGREQPMDADGPTMGLTTLALSPDDRRVAVTIEAVESSGLWIRELPDGILTRVSRHAGGARWPFWTSDGSAVSYISSTGGTPHLRRVRADGGSGGDSEVLLLRKLPIIEAVPAPARGGLIFVEDNPPGGTRQGFLNLETGAVTEELPNTGLDERSLALSPDGRWLAFVSSVSGRQVWVRREPFTGGRTQVSIDAGTAPVWAHNGRELFYVDRASGDMISATYTAEPDFQVRTRTRLFDATPYVTRWGHKTFDVTSDDQRFAMLRILPGQGRVILIENWFEELRERLASAGN
jgi:serine/threonine-protein kinase